MSKFPAKFLSPNDVGHRFRVTSVKGAKVESELIKLETFKTREGELRISAHMLNVSHIDDFGRGGFELDPESMVKRVDVE